MWEKSKYGNGEVDKKVTDNLNKLIHNLQHFPSERSRLDTTSLWNLIDKLESFGSENNSKSMHFTKTTERKTYKKKLIDLESSCENMKTYNTHRSCKINHKLKNGNPECNVCKSYSAPTRTNNQLQEKDFIKTKTTNTYICLSCKSKGKHSSNKFEIITNSKEIKTNSQGLITNLDKRDTKRISNMTRQNETKLKNTLQSKNNYFKNSIIKNIEKNKNFSTQRKEINVNSKERNYCHKCPVIKKVVRDERTTNKQITNKMKNLKCKSHQCTPNSNKDLQNLILDKDKLTMDKCSVVKKLTNYWNNLLNVESEECSTGNPGGSCQNIHSPDHLSCGVVNKSDDICQNNRTVKSRHLSESNINIMRRVDDLDSKRLFDAVQGSTPKPKPTNLFKPDIPINQITDEDNLKSWEDEGRGYIKKIDEIMDLSKTDLINELQNTFSTIKSLLNSDTLSDDIFLFQPITNKLLFILFFSSILKYKNNTIFKKLEIHADEVIKEITNIMTCVGKNQSKVTTVMTKQLKDVSGSNILSKSNNVEIDSDYISEYNQECSIDLQTPGQSTQVICCKGDGCSTIDTMGRCELPIEPHNSLILFTPRINLKQVENALRCYLIGREIIWSSMSYAYGDQLFTSCHSPRFNSFMSEDNDNFVFIYEEEIIIEEESSDADYDSQNDLENECGTNIDMFRLAAAATANCIENIIDTLINNRLEYPQIFVRMTYEALVSILIWWVLIKEIFL